MKNGELILAKGSQPEIILAADAEVLKAKALEGSRSITAVKDDFTNQVAVDSLKEIRSLSKALEASRVAAKNPALEFGRRVDAMAKAFRVELDAEDARLVKLASGFESEKRRKAQEAEDARQAILRRIEGERLAAENAERLKREAAERELLKAKSAKARQEVEEKLQIQRAEEEARRQKQAQEDAARVALIPVPAETKVEGRVVIEKWVADVVSLHALYGSKPEFVNLTARMDDINAALRGGMRECPGLVIRKEVKVGVR